MPFGTSPTSLFNLGGTPNFMLKEGANPSGRQFKKMSVVPSKGVIDDKTVREAENLNADFYRTGFTQQDLQATGEFVRSLVQPKTLEPDQSETQTASIRIVTGSGKEVKDVIPPYTKFILESVHEAHAERSQIIQTFGDWYIFMYGEQPPMYTFSGTLINARNFNWTNDFMVMYENFLRGTKCAELGARAIITYNMRQVEGFILGTGNQTTAITDAGVAFQFNMVVSSRIALVKSIDFGLQSSAGSSGSAGSTSAAIQDSVAGSTGAGLSSPETSRANDAARRTMSGESNPKAATDPNAPAGQTTADLSSGTSNKNSRPFGNGAPSLTAI